MIDANFKEFAINLSKKQAKKNLFVAKARVCQEFNMGWEEVNRLPLSVFYDFIDLLKEDAKQAKRKK